MHFHQFQKFVIVLVLVSFIGQSWALSMPSCASHYGSEMTPEMQMSDMDHSLHETESDTLTMTADCCGDNCVCPQSTSSALLLPVTQQRVTFNYSELHQADISILMVLPLITPLFRPPILS